MTKVPYILFRRSLVDDEEVEAAKKHFNVVFQHEEIPSGSLVIPRYSALPYYEYLEEGIRTLGSTMINTYRQHRYVADMQNWYQDLKPVTPRTWFSLSDLYAERTKLKPEMSFVLKGSTNSMKQQWNTHMFAKTIDDVSHVHSNLMADSLIGTQPIYIRKFVPLRKVGVKINGQPVTEEYRVFVLDGKVLTKAFYWSEYYDVVAPEDQDPANIPEDFLSDVIANVGDSIRFWVVDVARTDKGSWMVVELNDATMSGLSMTDPNQLYEALKQAL